MKYGIIIGSHRSKSESSKVAGYVKRQLKKSDKSATFYVLDLRNNPLPLWDESKWKPKGKVQTKWKPYSTKLKSCDAYVVISPEWAGMVPAGLKNIFLLCDKKELSHKPALIVTVSAGRGGAYPVSELRMSSYKNTQICYMPDHVIVRHVKDVLNDDRIDKNNKNDYYIKKRLIYSLGVLGVYAKAFKGIRKSNKIDLTSFPFGM